jgi:signal transduction histidine kinase
MTRSRRGAGEGGVGLEWATILAPLALGFLVSLLLAYQAFDAGRRHRTTARSVAREQAGFAAYLIGSSVERRLGEALLYAFYPIDLAFGRRLDSLPGPQALRAEPEVSRCGPGLPGDRRHFFRYDPSTGQVLVDGPDAPPLERWISSAFELTPEDAPEGTFRQQVADVDGRRTLIAHRTWKHEGRAVVYGFESCWRTAAGNVFEAASAATQAFSPALVGDTPNDSLFWLVARDGAGELLHGELWTRPEASLYGDGSFYGTVALTPADAFAGVELRVTLLPRVAERLVEGGLPASRLPLAIGLLTLTGALMGIAVRQLRRGHELVNLRARFVRNVSHELRTPLQQILLFTDLLRSGRLEDDAERSQALEIMSAETHRLIGMVGNLLRFSDTEGAALRLATVDLASVAEETVEAFRPLAAGRRGDIRVTTVDRVGVRADADALKRVLINLLDNAVKYGPEGQTIRVEVRRSEEWGEVSVSDSGPGIPEQDRARIWEAFSRLEREEGGATAGSGIGLSIVRQIIDSMGGRVAVRDAVPEGACFTFALPLSDLAS